MKQDDDTNQEISNEIGEDTGESTIASDIEEDDVNHQYEVLFRGLAC